MILRPSLDYNLYSVEFVSEDVEPSLRFNVLSVDVETAINEVRDYSALPFVLYYCGRVKNGRIAANEILKRPLVCAVSYGSDFSVKGGF